MLMRCLHPFADALRLSALPVLLFCLATTAVAGQTAEERIELLAAKLKALTERVSALESQTDAGITTTNTDDAGVAWQLGPDLSGRPLRVSHKVFDVDHGRLELLLEITDTLPNAADWQPSRLAPIVLTLRSRDGDEQSLPMTLLRGAKLEPGGHLHLIIELDPAQAAAANQIKIQRIPAPHGEGTSDIP